MDGLLARYPLLWLALRLLGVLIFLGIVVWFAGALVAESMRESGARRTLKRVSEVCLGLFMAWLVYRIVPPLFTGIIRSRPVSRDALELAIYIVLIAVALSWLRSRSKLFYGALELGLGLAILWITLPTDFDDPRLMNAVGTTEVGTITALIASIYVLVGGIGSLYEGLNEIRNIAGKERHVTDAPL